MKSLRTIMLYAFASLTTIVYSQQAKVELSEFMTVPDETRKALKNSRVNFIVKDVENGYFATICTRIYDPIAHIYEVKFNSSLGVIDKKEVKKYDTQKVYLELNYEKTNPWGGRLQHIRNVFSINAHGKPVYKYFVEGTLTGRYSSFEYNNINGEDDSRLNFDEKAVPQVISANRKYAFIGRNRIVNLDDGTSRVLTDNVGFDGLTNNGMRYWFGTCPYVEVDTGKVYVKKNKKQLFYKQPGCETDSKGNQEWCILPTIPPFLISFENGRKAVFGVLYGYTKKWNISGPTGFCTIEFDMVADTYKKVEQRAFSKEWKYMGHMGNKPIAECFPLNDGVIIKFEYGYKNPTVFNKHYDYHMDGHQDNHLYMGVNNDGTIASCFDGIVGDEHLITNFVFNGLYYEVTCVPLTQVNGDEKYQLLLTWYNKKGKQGEQTLCKVKSNDDHFDFIRMGDGLYEIVQLSEDKKTWRRGIMNLQ